MSIVSAYILPHPPLVIPEIGGEALAYTAKAYDAAARRIAALSPETLIVISPHCAQCSSYIHLSPGKSASGNFKRFGHQEVCFSVLYDEELAQRVANIGAELDIPCGGGNQSDPELDHGTMVPLYFINKYYKNYKLIRVSPSNLYYSELYKFGAALKQAAIDAGRRAVVIASGDLSHKLASTGPYGFAAEGPEFDKGVCEILRNGDFFDFMTYDNDFRKAAGECGLSSFVILSGAMDGQAVKTELLSYECPLGVGYAVCEILPAATDEKRRFGESLSAFNADKMAEIRKTQSNQATLAQLVLEEYVRAGKTVIPSGIADETMNIRAGVFVCLKLHGSLRGCMGTTMPTQRSVTEEIAVNAIAAASNDPRFAPVNSKELPEVCYTVDVLTPPEKTTLKSLNPQKYGVIVSDGVRRGVLLPMLDGVDTVAQQLEIALRKARIPEGGEYSLERFEVVRYQ